MPVVETDGTVVMKDSTVGALKAQIATTPYATNKAIMVAALAVKEANGPVPDSTKFDMGFSLNGGGHPPPPKP